MARHYEIGFAFRSNLYDSALSGQRCSDVDVAIHIQSQALRPTHSAIENGHGSVRVDFINIVETGGAGTGNEHISVRTESDVIGGNTWLQSRKNKNLTVARDLEYGSAAISDV